MKIAYFDCFSGAAGDMILASMIDAGVPVELFEDMIRQLGLEHVSLSATRVKRHSLAAMHVDVRIGEAAPRKHRHLRHILEIIDAAGLPPSVKQRAGSIFQRLAECEAAVHNTTIEKVHFHEVGAADAIVDVVGACVGLAHLQIDEVICSPIPTGSGSVQCEHGVMPIPAPATALLLRGAPLAACDEPGELCTPTGAAILTTIAPRFGPPPAQRLERVGVGAGTREGVTRPNVMRVLLGTSEGPGSADGLEHDTVVVLEAQMDDAPGQVLAFACERLLQAGALDAWLTPIVMKKGRPGQMLSVLARPHDALELEMLLLAETTTLGVRRVAAQRGKLQRSIESIQTRFGPMRLKVARRGAQVLRAWPEYDDCAAAARAAGTPLQAVQQEVLRDWWARHADAGGGQRG